MKYEVVFDPFTERHYIRTFAKKYKGAWDLTLSFIREEFEQIDILFLKSIAETVCISDDNDVKICKTEFKVAGTQVSRHASGNRCIIALHKSTSRVCVLLVYHKNDLRRSNETARWKALIKENYSEYAKMVR